MIQIPPCLPAGRQPLFDLRVRDRSLRARGSSEPEAGSETKGGERGGYNLSLFLGPIYPLTPTIQTPPKWRGYIGLFYPV